MKNRIYFLDNFRSFLIFLVVLLHCGIVYEAILENTWIVVDADKNNNIGLIRMYIDVFVMFALFFVSGFFIPGSINKKTNLAFISSKFKRIMIPWLVAVMSLIPAYKAIFLYSRGLPQEEWYTYFHTYTRPGGDMAFYADNPVQNWLWFLPVLFFFQMIYLLLSRYNLLPNKLNLKQGIAIAFGVGLVYAMLISITGLAGWHHSAIFHFQRERLLIYFMVFMLGAMAYEQNVFERAFNSKKIYIWMNLLMTLGLSVFTVVALNLFFNMIDPGRNFYFITPYVDRAIYYGTLLISMGSLIYVFLYAFKAYLNFGNKWLAMLSKNSYYVYIIHIVVLGLVAIPMLQWDVPAMLKFVILTIATFLISNILVNIYRTYLQKHLSNHLLNGGVIALAILLLSSPYFNQTNYPAEINSEISNPDSIKVTLHEAAITGDMNAIKQHIAAGSDLNKREPSGGSSPLITAALFGKTEVVKALINAGADIDLINNDGSTPLHTAAFFGRVEIVQELIRIGADTSILNSAGSTALASAEVPFDQVKGIFDYFKATFGPMGLELDYEELIEDRKKVADILKD
jgi:fucose 4-O-acetylase-like acetyltransferase